jgi:hypothetical protein
MSGDANPIHLLALRSLMRLFPMALLALVASGASAGVFCVRNEAELRNALEAAKDNGEHDQIRIRAGHLPSNGDSFLVSIEQNFSLNILGGWYGPNLQCDFVDPRPEATVIDGLGLPDTVFDIYSTTGDVSSSFWLYNLTVTGGAPADMNGGCVRVIGRTGTPTMNVERVILSGCRIAESSTMSGGAIYVYNGGNGIIRFRNNVIRDNTASSGAVALLQQKLAGLISFSNNTIVGNTALDAGSDSAAIYAVNMAGSIGSVFFINNLFHDNTAPGQQELRYHSVPGPSFLTLHSNALGTPLNGIAANESGNIATNTAMFDPATLVPRRDSALINAGYSNFNGGVGNVDLLNHPRTSNGAPDIGAIEADAEYLLKDSFD